MSAQGRTSAIRIAGALIMLLAAAAALLPLAQHIPGRTVVGLMLIAAGAIELSAVVIARQQRITSGLAAAATLIAGARLAVDPGANFFTVLNLVILWLVVRAAALFLAGRQAGRPGCTWLYFAAAVDFLLAVLLLGGLPVAVLIYGLFGQTSELIATFAWIFAASFIAAGLRLLVTARDQALGGAR